MKTCEICGKQLADYQGQVADGRLMCNSCLADWMLNHQNWWKCNHCGEWFSQGVAHDVRENNDGFEHEWCRKCIEGRTAVCDECGGRYELVEGGSDHLCPECASMEECPHCGERHRPSDFDTVHMKNGTTQEWCSECRSNDAWECEHCHTLFEDGVDSTEVHCRNWRGETFEETWCERCTENETWTCERCDETWSDEEGSTRVLRPQGCFDAWCPDCVENYATHCPHCDEYRDDDIENCPICQHGHLHQIIDYHEFEGEYIPRKAGVEGEERLYFGLEVETGVRVDPPWDRLDNWLDNEESPLIHFENDGSIEGPEMITQPCTLEYHQKKFDWEGLCRTLLRAGMRSHNAYGTGLHIHITRREELLWTMRKLQMHILNDKATWARIGRRGDIYNGYWDKCYTPLSYSAMKPHNGYTRYVVLNFKNDDTIELRTPRGTLNAETIKGTIEWLHAVIHALKYVSVNELMPEPSERPKLPETAGVVAKKQTRFRYAPDITREVILPYIWANKDRYPECIAMMTRMWAHQTVRPVLVTKEIKKAEWLANHEPGVKKQKIRR